MHRATTLFIALLLAPSAALVAAEPPRDVRNAAQRGLSLVIRAASNWQQNKTCFSCHHQTLPMLAATEAARAGLPLDAAWLKSQADTTHS